MRFSSFFNSLPFQTYIINKESNKTIFKNNNFLFDQITKEDDLINLMNTEGWKSCSHGYACYTKAIDEDKKLFLIITDLKVKPYWSNKGKTHGLSIVADKIKIQNYIDSIIQNYKSIINESNNEINQKIESFSIENIHEIRSINSSLYNIGYELQEKLMHSEKYILALSKNIVALSELISTRIELTDISAIKEEKEILKKSAPKAVFKAFDKI